MDHGQEQQPHNHCTEECILSIINRLIVKTSWLFNHGIICALLIREMFIARNIQLGVISISNVLISRFYSGDGGFYFPVINKMYFVQTV